jgi:hypothetical protein
MLFLSFMMSICWWMAQQGLVATIPNQSIRYYLNGISFYHSCLSTFFSFIMLSFYTIETVITVAPFIHSISIGYYLYDLWYCVKNKSHIYTGHHILTIALLWSSYLVSADFNHYRDVISLFGLAEITGVVMNYYYLCKSHSNSNELYNQSELNDLFRFFNQYFYIVRVYIIPVSLTKLIWSLYQQGSRWYLGLVIVCSVGLLGASYVWIQGQNKKLSLIDLKQRNILISEKTLCDADVEPPPPPPSSPDHTESDNNSNEPLGNADVTDNKSNELLGDYNHNGNDENNGYFARTLLYLRGH